MLMSLICINFGLNYQGLNMLYTVKIYQSDVIFFQGTGWWDPFFNVLKNIFLNFQWDAWICKLGHMTDSWLYEKKFRCGIFNPHTGEVWTQWTNFHFCVILFTN